MMAHVHRSRAGQHVCQAQVDNGVVGNENIVACSSIQQWRAVICSCLVDTASCFDSAECTHIAINACSA